MIAKAERPLILTASAGRDPAAFHALAQFTSICDSPGPDPPALFVVAIIAFHEPRLRSELPRSRRRSHPGDGDRSSLDSRPFCSVGSVQGHPMRVRPVACAHSHPRVCLRSRHHRLDSHDPPGTDALGGTRSRSALCISATRRSMERHLLDRRLLRPREMRRGDIVVPQEGFEPPLPCEN